MRAIVNIAPGELRLQEVPTPQPQSGQALIRTGACGICATDIKMIAGWDRTGVPAIPGHEWSGTVAAVGAGVDARLVGARCVAENVLSDGGEVGFEHPGGYGEYLLTEADKVHVLPADYPLADAALIEPLAVAVHGAARLRVEDKSRAIIFGDGSIGLLFLAVLCRAGVDQVTMVGNRPARLALARELGAAAVVNYHQAQGNLVAAIRRVTSKPFPNIIEASGADDALVAAWQIAAPGAHLLLVGDHGAGRADFTWNSLLHRELELIGSNASAGAWDPAVQLATSGKLPLHRLVSHRFPVHTYSQAIDLTRRRDPNIVKVVLMWE